MTGLTLGAKEQFRVSRAEERRVIIASSVGTVFEWYDFYLYAVLVLFFAHLFFPKGNETAALLGAFATYAVGFIVRPFGAIVLGRLGDIAGRKFTFLISIIFMGFSTFTVGLLPTFEELGWIAPILLVLLRVLQGVALGGEYGGAATYVAEYTEAHKRGYATSWIQTTASVGLLLAILVIGLCRWQLSASDFEQWGWRIPFLLSIFLLIPSIYIRVILRETPVFIRIKAEGRSSKTPLWESFFRSPNNKYVLLSLLGATAGQGVVLYTAQFYTLYFLTIPLQLDYLTAYVLTGIVLAASMPFFVVFGWLSDKIGRLKIILAGLLLGALTYFPLFQSLSQAVNPALVQFQRANSISIRMDPKNCNFYLFLTPWSNFTTCDQVTDFLTKSGLSFKKSNSPGFDGVLVSIGSQTVEIGGQQSADVGNILRRALFSAGYPGLTWKFVNGEVQMDSRGRPAFEFQGADPARVNYFMSVVILFILTIYATMVYGPMAAFLVELFPANIRYTSLSLPYHIGNGIFGGLLPYLATAIVAATGNVYAGLWYPVTIALISCVVGGLFLRHRVRKSIFS